MSHLLHETATIICPHAGQITVGGANPRVKVSGFGVATMASFYPIAGCTFTTESPKPCTTAQWTAPATRVTAGGSPVILEGEQHCPAQGHKVSCFACRGCNGFKQPHRASYYVLPHGSGRPKGS